MKVLLLFYDKEVFVTVKKCFYSHIARYYMNPFKSYTYTWKQIGIFKVALLSIGILIGSYWHEFFGTITTLLLVIALVTTAYVLYVSFKQ